MSLHEQVNRYIKEIGVHLNDLYYWVTLENWDGVYKHAEAIARAAIEILASIKAESNR